MARVVQVKLDCDLALLYGVEAKALNQAVKRNINRFPERYMFQLTNEEFSRSRIVTADGGRENNIKYLPYEFSEQGVAMESYRRLAIKYRDKSSEQSRNFRAFG